MNDGMITKGNWRTFLTLVGEKLLFVQRKHIFVIFLPILFISVTFSLLLLFASFIFLNTLDSIPLFITTALLLLSITLSFITKIIIDWYFHLYILTNRKILEVWYTPLASYVVNDVMLDKVNCTEIDLHKDGFIRELLDIGSVVITFDRPTHEEEFVLRDIPHSNSIEKFLERQLMDHQTNDSLYPMWFRGRNSFARNA